MASYDKNQGKRSFTDIYPRLTTVNPRSTFSCIITPGCVDQKTVRLLCLGSDKATKFESICLCLCPSPRCLTLALLPFQPVNADQGTNFFNLFSFIFSFSKNLYYLMLCFLYAIVLTKFFLQFKLVLLK